MPARVLVLLIAIHAFFLMRGSLHPQLTTVIALIELLLAAHLAIEAFTTVVIDYLLAERRQIQMPPVLRHLVQVVLYTVAVLSIFAEVTGTNLVPLLATSTVVTVVVGLALQDTLGNLFSGLALHAEKPFELSDWLQVDGIEGQVIYVGWRSTRLRTLAGNLVVVPNSSIARSRIHNFDAPTHMLARYIDLPVTLTASPTQVEEAARQASSQTSGVRIDPPIRIWLVSITPLFQRYTIKFWIDGFQLHDEIESDLMKALWHACTTAGILPIEAQPFAAIDPTLPTLSPQPTPPERL